MAEAVFDNGFTHKGIGLVIATRHAAVLAEPAEGALDYPASVLDADCLHEHSQQ